MSQMFLTSYIIFRVMTEVCGGKPKSQNSFKKWIHLTTAFHKSNCKLLSKGLVWHDEEKLVKH